MVIVTHDSSAELPRLLDALAGQMLQQDELVIVDNASTDGTPDAARKHPAVSDVIQTATNLGFAGGCQVGVKATVAPLLLFLNPDVLPHHDCLGRLRAGATEHPEWAAWQAAVLLDAQRINSSGGVIHYLGIGWAGSCERPIEELPARDLEIPFASGAALVVRREVWVELGGMDAGYFMYGEDLDFGLRLWLAGYRVGLLSAARVTHGYEFEKGAYKWFWLERNRYRTVLSVYPGVLLALLLPALIASELGLLVVAARQGWLVPKLRAQAVGIADLPHTLVRRRRVQRTRSVSVAEFADRLTASLDSPYITVRGVLARALQAAYWRAVRTTVTLLSRPPATT